VKWFISLLAKANVGILKQEGVFLNIKLHIANTGNSMEWKLKILMSKLGQIKYMSV
jgi:hypothetical protein